MPNCEWKGVWMISTLLQINPSINHSNNQSKGVYSYTCSVYFSAGGETFLWLLACVLHGQVLRVGGGIWHTGSPGPTDTPHDGGREQEEKGCCQEGEKWRNQGKGTACDCPAFNLLQLWFNFISQWSARISAVATVVLAIETFTVKYGDKGHEQIQHE